MQLWDYPETVGRTDTTGFAVEARDGTIGKVSDATLEAGSSYLVVDTGSWIFGKKVLVPAGTVSRVERKDETVYVDLTKDEIKEAPEFDSDAGFTDAYRDSLASHYEERRKNQATQTT
jgi:hypothetical protein